MPPNKPESGVSFGPIGEVCVPKADQEAVLMETPCEQAVEITLTYTQTPEIEVPMDFNGPEAVDIKLCGPQPVGRQ